MFHATSIRDKHIMTIAELIEKEKAKAAKYQDIISKPENLVFGVDEQRSLQTDREGNVKEDKDGNPLIQVNRFITARDRETHQEYQVQETALRHLCSKINVPKSAFRRLSRATAENVLNELLPKAALSTKDHLLRVARQDDGTVKLRGLLTVDHYHPFDVVPALEMLLPALDPSWGVSRYEDYADITSFGLTSDLVETVVVGEPARHGLYFRDSELGFSSFEILLFVFIGRCSNGQILPRQKGMLRVPHISSFIKEVPGKLQALMSGSQETWERIGTLYKQTEEVLIDDPEFFMLQVAKRFDLSKELRRNIFDNHYKGPQEKCHLRQIVDAYTEAAHSMFPMKSDTYRKLESIGADLTEEWKNFIGKHDIKESLPEGPTIEMENETYLLTEGAAV